MTYEHPTLHISMSLKSGLIQYFIDIVISLLSGTELVFMS